MSRPFWIDKHTDTTTYTRSFQPHMEKAVDITPRRPRTQKSVDQSLRDCGDTYIAATFAIHVEIFRE